MPKCPSCKVPGEQHLVVVDGVKDGKRCGWQQYELCHTCGGTNEISEERVMWMERGKAMRKARIAKYETQREAAARLGVGVVEYSKMEFGRIEPKDGLNG